MRISKSVIVLLLIIMMTYYWNSLDVEIFNKSLENEALMPRIGTTIKTDSGRFQGRIDSNFIEIKLSGIPDILAKRTFVVPDHLKLSFEDMGLNYDDSIVFNYVENEQGQLVILNIFTETITS